MADLDLTPPLATVKKGTGGPDRSAGRGPLRIVTLSLVGLLGCAILWISVPQSVATFYKLIGGQSVDLLLLGQSLTPYGAERVEASRRQALRWVNDRRSHIEIGVANLDQAMRLRPGSVQWSTQLAAAEQAFYSGLELSVVQPVAWLLVARLHIYRSDWDAAAAALAMSLRTAHFIGKDARERSIIGLTVWPGLDAETIDRLMESIAATVEREPELVVRLAADWALEEEIAARLVDRSEDGARLWRAFARALYAETGEALLPLMTAP